MDAIAHDAQPLGSTFAEILRRRSLYHPDRNAYRFLLDGETQEVSFSYAELDYQARHIAAYLQSQTEPGARVLLLYPPGLEYIAAIFGCWYAGVVAVPAYPPRLNQNLARIEAIIQDAEAKVALTTPGILSGLERKFANDPLIQRLRWMTFEGEEKLAGQWREYLPTGDALALLQYTSGSTGTPKGVMITHGNLVKNAMVIQKSMSLDSDISCVSWLPAYHDMGLMGLILEPFYLGGSSVLMSPASFLQQPMRWLQTISRFKANTSGAPNFAFDLCVSKATPEALATLDLSSWELAFVGSEPVHAETLERFYHTFAPSGFRREAFYPCYGMAEATLLISGGLKKEPPIVDYFSSSTLTQHRPVQLEKYESKAHQLVGCGTAQAGQRILIVDPDSRVAYGSGRVGEIWVASPNVGQGYWRKPQETQETFRAYLKDSSEGPFLRTGDLGFFNGDELFITGRLKDLMIIRGQNYYPQDIEKTAELSHKALKQNCSAAFSLEVEGEERTILVMEIDRQYRSQEPQEIFSAIRQAIIEEYNLHIYAIVLIRPGSILKTSSGKIQRSACRHALLDQSLTIMFADLPRPVGELIAQHKEKQDETITSGKQFVSVDNTKSQVEMPAVYSDTEMDKSVSKRSERSNMQFSLLYFASNASEANENKYELLIEGAKFADQNDFTAIWIPERHFHPFGGLYPNPSVLASALSIATQKIRLRAGSVVLPLHHPIRVAEEWAVIDNLSSGRVDLAFALGWNPNDFVLAPTQYANRKDVLFSGIEMFQKLWRGDAITLPNGLGKEVAVKIYPSPLQSELTPWITCTSSPERFIEAGAMGANVLTGLLFQSAEELAEKIKAYRNARAEHGYDPATGQVTLMLHTFLGDDIDEVREKVRPVFTEYLKSSVDLWRKGAKKLDDLTSHEQEQVLSYAFERYFQTHALFGTLSTCSKMVEYLYHIGVDEIACLIDFGLDTETVMDGLYFLNKLRKRFAIKNSQPSKEVASSQNTANVHPIEKPAPLPSDIKPEKAQREKVGALEVQDQELFRQLLKVSQSRQVELLETYLQRQVAQVLERDVEELTKVENIRSLGLDSLYVMSVVNNCQRDLQVSLDAGQFYEHTSFKSLALYIAEEFRHLYHDGVPVLPPTLQIPLQSMIRDGGVPLSFAQERLWFLEQLDPGKTFYNEGIVLRLQGALNTDILERSFNEIIYRHEILRTTFTHTDSDTQQYVAPWHVQKLVVTDFREHPLEVRETYAYRLIQAEVEQPFDFIHGPLFKVQLFQLAEEEFLLLTAYHHIIGDGWSIGVLYYELSELYTAYTQGKASPLKPLPIQYADYTLWQRQWLQGEVLQEQLAYWQQQLKDAPVQLRLLGEQSRSAIQTYVGSERVLLLPTELSQQLKLLSQRENVSLHMTLLAAFQILLMRYSGQQDFLVGSLVANRSRRELENLIGFFVNMLALRADLSGNPSFQQLLLRVRDITLQAYAHQDLPFEKLVVDLKLERNLSRHPLCQVAFELQHFPFSICEMPGVAAHLESVRATSDLDLLISLREREDGLLTTVVYNTDLFKTEMIDRLLTHWQTLLQSIVDGSHLPISALSCIPQRERERLLVEWNQTQVPSSKVQGVHQLIAAQALHTPDRIALSFQDEQISYAQLNQRASRLARQLREEGIGTESLIAILAERSIPLIVGILAVFKAGGAYLPLDPTSPSQRLLQILTDAKPQMLLTTRQLATPLSSLNTTRVYWLETVEDALSPLPSWQEEDYDQQQLSYVIYTSGSTGRPKGVMISQQGMFNHLCAKVEELQLQSEDCVAQNASSSFDISVWQMWAALLQGGRVHIVSHEEAQQPHLLWLRLREQAVTVLELVPSLLRMLLDELENESANVSDSELHLRVLMATGETLVPELCSRWLRLQRNIPIVNAYGPTECSDDVTHAWLDDRSSLSSERVSIGRPLRNTQLYVLDGRMDLLPVGGVGELYVGGKGVGRGYLGAPDVTAAAFVPDPWSQEPGMRLYRTGDLVRYLEDGKLEYIGRVDEQVKLRGYRIELSEIEMVLEQQPEVQKSVVQLYQSEQEFHSPSIVAYLVVKDIHERDYVPLKMQNTQEMSAANGLEQTANQTFWNKKQQELIHKLRQSMAQVLPGYMVPDIWMIVPEIPLTPNGKVDRRSLPTPEKHIQLVPDQLTEVRTPVEEIILGIYCDLLNVEQISVHESFFDLGGHSLLATQAIARIRKLLHIEIPLRSLFEDPSVAGLAQRIEQSQKQLGIVPPLVSVSRKQDIPLSFAQERLWILQQLEPSNTSYHMPAAFRISGPLSIEIFDRCLQAMMQRHESLRTTFEMRAEQSVQMINPHLRLDLPIVNLEVMDESKRSFEVACWIHDAVAQPFDLSQGPLLRAGLLRINEMEHVFLVVIHHILFDAWSTSVFLRDLPLLYQAFVEEKPAPLVPHVLQYADFAFWQRSWLKGEPLNVLVDYWTEQLRGAIPLELPTDRPRTASISDRGALYTFKIPSQLTQEMRALSRREGVTAFMTLLTAFQIVLYHYTGQQDIVVGTDIANRTMMETEDMIGFFVNLLVLRTRLRVQATFSEMLKNVSAMMLDAYAHQNLPFEKLVDALQLAREPGRIPLVNVLFVLQNVPAQSFELPGLTVDPIAIEINTAKFDVAMFLVENGQELLGTVNYRTDLFDADMIARLVHHFETLLQNCITYSDISIEMLEMQTKEEKEQQLRNDEKHAQTQQRRLKTTKRRVVTSSSEN